MSSWSPAATTRSKSCAFCNIIKTCVSATITELTPWPPHPPPSTRIQEHLLYALNAHQNNWPTQVQNRALALLRSGEATSFPLLLRQILEEVRKETALEPRPDNSSAAANGSNSNGNEAASTVQVNGAGGKKANGAGPGPGEASNLHQNTTTSLAIPTAVVEEALKVTKDALTSVAEFEDGDGAT